MAQREYTLARQTKVLPDEADSDEESEGECGAEGEMLENAFENKSFGLLESLSNRTLH